MENELILSISEQIDRARDGRSQSWIVNKMKENGIKISDSQFSRKKKGFENFTELEKKVLKKIINVNFK